MQTKPQPILFLDDHRGVYIPRDFAECIRRECVTYRLYQAEDVTADLEILKRGPDGETYWDTWSDVLDHAIVTDDNGQQFTLYQDGALWLIPEGMSWSDRDEWFTWEPDVETESSDAE